MAKVPPNLQPSQPFLFKRSISSRIEHRQWNHGCCNGCRGDAVDDVVELEGGGRGGACGCRQVSVSEPFPVTVGHLKGPKPANGLRPDLELVLIRKIKIPIKAFPMRKILILICKLIVFL